MIREYRLLKKVKTKEMAKILGVTRITYYKKEVGDIKFSLEEAKKIAEYFGEPIESIFFNDEVSKIETDAV